MISQRGGFVMGLVVGLLVGLALALGVALYITKAPVPFVNKVPQRTAEQDTAEAERNRNWDPNAPLGGKPGKAAAAAASAAAASASAPATTTAPVVAVPAPVATPPARDPAAILSGAPVPPAPVSPPVKPSNDAFVYFVQAGAFTRNEDAEQQRAKLAMMGALAKISERDQAGRVVYRVRLGPYPSREEADSQLTRLQEQNIEAQIVRVEKP
jgi:cell division protein FtsN